MNVASRVENWSVLAGALLLSGAFGSIHAFGVLLAPLEVELEAGRGPVSFGYSLAIAALTAGVFLSPAMRKLATPPRLAAACGLFAFIGLGMAASGAAYPAFLVGYGLIFGLSNGVAYSLSLDRAAHSAPSAPGWAMGLATASYGLGAAGFSQVLGWLVSNGTAASALWVLAVIIACASLAAAGLLGTGSEVRAHDGQNPQAEGPVPLKWTALMWVIYFLGASAGLMIIAHAAGIMTGRGAGPELALAAPVAVALGGVAGSAMAGALADRWNPRLGLALPLMISTAAMAALLVGGPHELRLAALTICGGAYGALIAVVPAVIRKSAGQAGFGRAFGYIFTSWGVAGLCSPMVAGVIFDYSGHYTGAVWLAGLAGLCGCALTMLLPPAR